MAAKKAAKKKKVVKKKAANKAVRRVTVKGPHPAIIHVNRAYIAINAKLGEPVLPVYTAKLNGPKSRPTYAYGIKFDGPGELIDPRERNQLSCGARAWVEVGGVLELTGAMTFADADKLRKKVSARL